MDEEAGRVAEGAEKKPRISPSSICSESSEPGENGSDLRAAEGEDTFASGTSGNRKLCSNTRSDSRNELSSPGMTSLGCCCAADEEESVEAFFFCLAVDADVDTDADGTRAREGTGGLLLLPSGLCLLSSSLEEEEEEVKVEADEVLARGVALAGRLRLGVVGEEEEEEPEGGERKAAAVGVAGVANTEPRLAERRSVGERAELGEASVSVRGPSLASGSRGLED